jgi:cytochrome c nitrite reductase small subunit
MRTRFGVLSLAGLALSCLLGVFIGVSAFTFEAAQGGSYLSNDPTACTNCHIMRPQYDSWQKSSHHAFATCNDCHVPPGFLGKYFTKAENGYRHSWGFTFQNFHEPIQLHPRSRPIIQNNCVYCHGELMSEITVHESHWGQTTDCIRCHSSVGHGANP